MTVDASSSEGVGWWGAEDKVTVLGKYRGKENRVFGGQGVALGRALPTMAVASMGSSTGV